MKKIEFYKHNLTKEDKATCLQVLDSLFLTTGETVKEFEEKFASYLKTKYVVAVSSCTDALFLSLKCIGITEGDEVITTPLSFISTANAIEHCGAKTVFVDCEKDTGNIDVSNIEKAITFRTKAIIVVHLYGQMADMRGIKKIADKYSLKVIEDCAHCIEGEREGVRPGELSDFACFSFYATKNITSGEGGAISTNNKASYEWLCKGRLHGMSKNALDRYTKKYEHYDMEFLGYKANMTNIQAALLIHQLDRIESYHSKKEKIVQKYNKGFGGNPSITIPSVLPNLKHAWYIYTILVSESKRELFLEELQRAGIGIAVNFRPIHLMKYYYKKYNYGKGSFPYAENIGGRTITIPLYPKLTKKEINTIIKTVNRIVTE